jgi:hypothetical protein
MDIQNSLDKCLNLSMTKNYQFTETNNKMVKETKNIFKKQNKINKKTGGISPINTNSDVNVLNSPIKRQIG